MSIKKIPNLSGLLIRTGLSAKISEVENKIPDTSSLVTTTILKTKTREVANKILDNDKYITTPEFNKLTTENFAARLTLSDTGFFELQKHNGGEGGRAKVFALLIQTFVLEQQSCSNLVGSFNSRSRVHKSIQNCESTQTSQIMAW